MVGRDARFSLSLQPRQHCRRLCGSRIDGAIDESHISKLKVGLPPAAKVAAAMRTQIAAAQKLQPLIQPGTLASVGLA